MKRGTLKIRPEIANAPGGTLTIEIKEAKLERDTETLGKMDCFVEIKYKDQVQRTSVVNECGQTPVWEEKLDFVIDSLSDLFTITCFDEDNVSNDLVGTTQVSIPMLTAVEFNFDQWMVLYY